MTTNTEHPTPTPEALEALEALEAATGARLPYLDMRVIFDPERLEAVPGLEAEYLSHADQRDMRRAQIAIGCDPDLDPLGFNRACAWAYLNRTGALAMGWADFDAGVAFVIPADRQTTADPTGPGPAG